MTLVVYTAITQGYDPLRQPPLSACGDTKFVAFMEAPTALEPWECRTLTRRSREANRDAKKYKILPHEFLPEYEYSLWIDGKVEIIMNTPITELLEFLKDADLAIFAHQSRYCLYQEACECIHRNLDDPAIIYSQVQRYTKEGFPANEGLVDANIILRRHSPAMIDFCRAWWQEITDGSKRDQLSFNYVAWRRGFKYNLFPGDSSNNPFIKRHRHLKSSR